MLELINAARVIGVGKLRRLRRSHRLVWPDMLNGFVLTRVIQTLLNVGFFDELREAGRIEVGTFAAARNFDEKILSSLCDALYASRILEKDGDAYVLTEHGQLLIDTGRGWFTGVYGYEPVYHDLEKLLRKSGSYGVDVRRLSDAVAKGSGEAEAMLFFPLAIDYIVRQGYRHVLDLGCGDGTFLRNVCSRVPEVRGYGIDMAADTIADAGRLTREAGMADRLSYFTQDIVAITERAEPLRQVDFATTFFVLHEILHHGSDAVVAFLRGFRRMFPGVPLMVFEVDRPSLAMMRSKRAGMAIPYFLQHDLSNQKPIAREEWPRLFEAAGVEHIETRPLGFARSVIFVLR